MVRSGGIEPPKIHDYVRIPSPRFLELGSFAVCLRSPSNYVIFQKLINFLQIVNIFPC